MRVLLVIYDNGSFVNFFPMGMSYIASVLLREGYEVEVYNQDKFHYPDKHLTGYLNKNVFDVVCVSVIAGYYQYKKLLKLSEAINKSRKRPFYIIGGHGPSPEPEYFLKKTKADVAVIGEGELTIVELMKAITGRKSVKKIKGIAYRDGKEITANPRRTLIKNIDNIEFPAYKLFPVDYYKLMRIHPLVTNTDFVIPIVSGRGCTFKCNFCYRLDKGFRARSPERIVEEIKYLKTEYGITYIGFSDELLMTSIERVVSLCESFTKGRLKIRWYCNGRLNYAKPEVLKIMKKAGCVFINYGIEAMDDTVLKNMRKGLRVKQVIKGIETTLDAGISPGLNIIWGNIGDNKETLNKGVEFLLKYDDCAQLRTIRPVTPYPGSPLYHYAIEKGLLRDCEDFYENKHKNSDLVTVNFTDMNDDEFHKCLLDANTRLLTNYYQKKMNSSIKQTKELYLKRDASFRGYRQH